MTTASSVEIVMLNKYKKGGKQVGSPLMLHSLIGGRLVILPNVRQQLRRQWMGANEALIFVDNSLWLRLTVDSDAIMHEMPDGTFCYLVHYVKADHNSASIDADAVYLPIRRGRGRLTFFGLAIRELRRIAEAVLPEHNMAVSK